MCEDIYQNPQLTRGVYNIVLNVEEKIGGLIVTDSDYEEFENYISSCDLTKIQF